MRSGKYLILTLIFLGFLLSPLKAETQNDFHKIIQQAKEFKKTGQIYFNFEKIDLKLLTYFISGLTGKNIVLSADIKGEISLVFPEPVSIEDAWNIYTSILKSRNYVLVNKGTFYEVIPSGFSRSFTPPVKPELEKSEDMVTYVYKFKNADVTQALNVLRGLKSPKGLIFSYNPANIIVLTDTQSNIKNLKQIISLIDTPAEGMEIKVYKLQYSSSTEITAALTSIFSDLSKKGVQLKAYNLKSQNAVVVKAPSYVFKEIENIISILDQPTPHPTYRKFWTIYLKNSKAEDISNVLNKLLENIRLVSIKEGKTKGKTQIKNLKTYTTPISNQKTDRPKVVADKSSNAIIIYANKTEYEAIKELIQNLDKQKKQVLVTALITEVSEQALREIGVRWQIFGSQGGAAFRGGISKEGFYNVLGSTNFVAGVLSTSGENVTIGGNTLFFPDLLFLFSLLERGTGFNIVSSPKILTMDNIEASINVSQVTPFAQSVKFDINGNPIINYDYKEVGLILKVTPHISEDNIVMEIHQEVNEVIGYEKPQIGEISYVVPITSKRELNTTITVTNGKTIVLGGLVSKKTIKTMEGVPFFSSIPIIGNLFKYRSEDLNKTNLFVFLTPFIIEKPEDLAKITEEHQRLSEALLKGKIKEGQKKTKYIENNKKKDIFEDYRQYFGG